MRFFTFYFLIIFFASCSTNSDPPALPEGAFGLVSSVPPTNTLTLNSKNNLLWAGTDQGVYKKMLDNTGQDWQLAGLDVDSAEVVDFIIVDKDEIFGAIMYEEVRTQKPTLFKTMNGGGSWSPVQINAPPEIEYFVIHDLEVQANGSNNFFAYVGRVMKSTDNGSTWSISYQGGGFSDFLSIPANHPNQIWTGGDKAIPLPYLAKSEDGGDNWDQLDTNFNFGESAIRDVAVHPNRADVVLAGTQGLVTNSVIRRSTNGGQSWETVLEEVGTLTLAHSAQTPGRVYGSGISIEGRLFFVASPDFGKSWETVTMEGGPVGILVNDMISVMEEGKEVLYFATDQGVYSYRFED